MNIHDHPLNSCSLSNIWQVHAWAKIKDCRTSYKSNALYWKHLGSDCKAHVRELSLPTARGGKWHDKIVLNTHQRLT